jgi:hypothetical protein
MCGIPLGFPALGLGGVWSEGTVGVTAVHVECVEPRVLRVRPLVDSFCERLGGEFHRTHLDRRDSSMRRRAWAQGIPKEPSRADLARRSTSVSHCSLVSLAGGSMLARRSAARAARSVSGRVRASLSSLAAFGDIDGSVYIASACRPRRVNGCVISAGVEARLAPIGREVAPTPPYKEVVKCRPQCLSAAFRISLGTQPWRCSRWCRTTPKAKPKPGPSVRLSGCSTSRELRGWCDSCAYSICRLLMQKSKSTGPASVFPTWK